MCIVHIKLYALAIYTPEQAWYPCYCGYHMSDSGLGLCLLAMLLIILLSTGIIPKSLYHTY